MTAINIKTVQDCCKACKDLKGCTFFTFRKDKMKCWMKNSNAVIKAKAGTVSGSVDCCKGNI